MSTLNATNQDLEGLEKTTFFRTFFFFEGGIDVTNGRSQTHQG